MIDYHKTLVSVLKRILPTHYEMTITANTPTPCITYLELSNAMAETGTTLGFSHIAYQIKVWSTELADLQKYALIIDETLRPLGWKRISSNEMYDNASTMMQKILTYEATGLERY